MKSFVAYYRVSTDKQGRSGLGLDAQREAVRSYLDKLSSVLVAEYTEVESGAAKKRPELTAALAECRKQKCTLIIAKLDRLARNVHVISGLMESGVDFVAADNPHANKLMLHLLAAFAEHEREQIAARTKAALKAARERGVHLGRAGKQRAIENMRLADRYALELVPIVGEAREAGAYSYSALAHYLNAKGQKSFRNGAWYAATAKRLSDRINRLEAQ